MVRNSKSKAKAKANMFSLCDLEKEMKQASPPFRSSVLEPGLDLSVGHLQGFSQGGPLSRRQVLLSVEPLLQLADLQPGEGRPRFLLLRWRPVLIGMTYTTCYSEG